MVERAVTPPDAGGVANRALEVLAGAGERRAVVEPEREVGGDRRRQRAAGAVRVPWWRSAARAARTSRARCTRRRPIRARPGGRPSRVRRAGRASGSVRRRPACHRSSGSSARTALRLRGRSASRCAPAAATRSGWRRPRPPRAGGRRPWPPSPDRRRRAGRSSSAMAAATASTMAALASMPTLTASAPMSPATASICAVTRSVGERPPHRHAERVLGGDRGDR